MGRKGLDYSFDRPTSLQAVKAAGYDFVIRYAGGSKSKDLTHDEAVALSAAGIDIVANFEASATNALRGFSQGVDDAHEALSEFAADGMPAGRPIYFSVDFDASEAQQATINSYFDGILSVMPLSQVGAYGGFYVIKRLKEASKISWLWQTYAWSGGQWYTGLHLRQEKNGVLVAGADSDIDEAFASDFGQWRVSGTVVIVPITDKGDWELAHWTTVKKGTTGQAAKNAQGLLKAHLLDIGLTGPQKNGIDGNFGDKCVAATKTLQRMYGIPDDGEFGPQTFSVASFGHDYS